MLWTIQGESQGCRTKKETRSFARLTIGGKEQKFRADSEVRGGKGVCVLGGGLVVLGGGWGVGSEGARHAMTGIFRDKKKLCGRFWGRGVVL